MANETTSIQSIVEREKRLIKEASLTIPHSFSTCTYSLGHIRQNVYLCKTCNTPRGICAPCSVACHTDHDQVELFAKRNFRCDCPTCGLEHPCSLVGGGKKIVNEQNRYGKNFENGAEFCRCGREYDAKTERETMVQCLSCEDWFHESCVNLRERMPPLTAEEIAAMGNDSSTVATNEIDTLPSSDAVTADETDARSDAVTDDEDAEGSVTDPSFPPALLPGSAYDALVCRDCVLKIPLLMKYAGSEGVMMVIRDGEEDDWRVIGRPGKSRANDGKNGISVDTTDATVEAGEKRKREEDVNAALNGEKRPRLDSSREANCLAPLPNSYASSIFKILKSSGSEASVQGAGDIFLDEDFRLRWCRCEECLPDIEKHPYLIEEEEVYEPPKDPDSKLSFEELGMRALSRIPRDRAIDGIVAYQRLRDELMAYLRPFAEDGKAVSEEDINAFFAAKQAAKEQAA